MVTSDFRPEVEIRPFHACAMHPAIITGTVRSLLTWLWGRYHVPQNAFLVILIVLSEYCSVARQILRIMASRRELHRDSQRWRTCLATTVHSRHGELISCLVDVFHSRSSASTSSTGPSTRSAHELCFNAFQCR